jgi:2'-5' RNA ligase
VLVDRTPDAGRLRDHWWWRPGWEPGSRHLQWHLTFEGQCGLHDTVRSVQDALSGVDELEPVPLPWLHLTLAGFGEATAVTEDCVRQVINAAHERLASIPRVDLEFSRVTVYAESVVLTPEPSPSLAAVQALVEESGRHVLGQETAGISVPFAPHLSVAYCSGPAEGDAVVAALAAVGPLEPVLAQPTLSLVEVERDGRAYTWRLVSAFPL